MDCFDSANIIAIISLIISIILVVLNVKRYLKEKFSIVIKYEENFCFFIEPVSTAYGNDNSAVLSVRIINSSVYPITISKISMLGGKTRTGNGFAEYPAENIDNLSFVYDNGDSTRTLNLANEQLKLPLKIEPFDEKCGYIIFPYSWGSDFSKSKNHLTKWRIKYSTSRGIKINNCNILDKGYLNERY